MSWTSPADLRAQVQKLWDKGQLLVPASDAFPLRLRLMGPTSQELTLRFDETRSWVNSLRQGALHLRVVDREFRHSVLGHNAVPNEVWLDTLTDALALLGKQKEARRFAGLLQITGAEQPRLLPWLEKRPLNALALAHSWPRLLGVVSWLQAHPRPGIYLRQVDVPGVDSKFMESNRGVLAELFDLALSRDAIDVSASGASQFCRRYGFRDKPLRIRFRLYSQDGKDRDVDHDMTITQAAFAQLKLAGKRVFITENEINFLAFPVLPNSLVIFGSGYGFEVIRSADWLQQSAVYYWGDIDTHGFAMLDQLRAQLPHARSLLMDEATLMAHQSHWGEEPKPERRDLTRLTPQEIAVYQLLRDDELRPCLRLEQERISFGWVKAALAGLPDE